MGAYWIFRLEISSIIDPLGIFNFMHGAKPGVKKNFNIHKVTTIM
jgi:hypothetical protein